MISKMLVGLDGSPLGERTLPYAEALARAAGASVCLVQVVPLSDERERLQEENPRLLPYMVAVPGAPPATEKVEERAARHGATRYVDAIATRLGAAGVPTEAVVVRGEPAAALAAEAIQRRADLVLLSTHGRSGLGRWVFGSVAEGVLARSDVPVLLVRAAVAGPTPRLPGPKAPIVVPLDGSPLAEQAIPVAATLARALSAEIRLARLVPAPAA